MNVPNRSSIWPGSGGTIRCIRGEANGVSRSIANPTPHIRKRHGADTAADAIRITPAMAKPIDWRVHSVRATRT